jgi:hypothetical protein
VRRAGLAACALFLGLGPSTALAQEVAGVEATISPRTALFGDPVEVRAVIVAERGLSDPEDIELVDPDFAPFEAGELRRETAEGSRLSRLTYRITLRCLAAACLPAGDASERVFSLPALRFELSDETTLEAELPPVRVVPRLDRREVREAEAWSYDDRTLPAAGFRVDPALATALLWAAAVVLALLGAALAVYAVTGRAARGTLRPRRGTVLERALALARRAAPAGGAERRKALEHLARELERAGHPALSERSGVLAWSRPEPSEDAVLALVDDAERAIAKARP